MTTENRPLSPHLQAYRLPVPAVLSFLHRLTGLGLAAGAVVLVWWLASAAAGPEAFEAAREILGSIIGRVLLLGWTAALFYHLFNGIRHLFWDAGFGFEMKTVYATGWLVVAATVVLTVLTWILGYAMR